MPIKPENRARYPSDWPACSLAAKARAGFCCEGSPAYPDCRLQQHAIGYRCDAGLWRQLGVGDRELHAHLAFEYGDLQRVIRVVLTVGHLDHTPENCAPENLRAWCQRCHLAYDAEHHSQSRAASRRKGRALGDLF